MLKSVLSCLALMSAFLFPSVPALAQASSSPQGLWELKVSGTYEGEKVNGVAYLEFDAEGGVEGYYLSRETYTLVEVGGTWTQSGTSFTGEVDIFDEGGENPLDTLIMSGKAKAGKSLSAKLTPAGSSSSIKVSGKPFALLPDLEGSYTGTIRQYGVTVPLDIELVADPEQRDGLYELSGSFVVNGQENILSGLALAARDGRYVAFVYNETLDLYASVWGKIKVGSSFTGSGISLDDGSSIKVSMTPAG